MKKGIILLACSALFFALATLFAKFVTTGTDVSAFQVTFFRFLFGFIFASVWMARSSISFRPHKMRYIVLRALFNTTAVILFFMGVKNTTITNANMLNMTYPVFVFLCAPLINRERVPREFYLYLVLTMGAVYLMAIPDFNRIRVGDLFSLGSALLAGIAISSLREARKYDYSQLILFYLMGFGVIFNFFILLPVWKNPTTTQWVQMLLSGLLGVAGQYCLTVGYRYISASGGSLVSASRLLWATLFGMIFFAEILTWRIIGGFVLLLISLVGLSGGWNSLRDYFKNRARS